jgi:HlyD family secretion protein
MRVQASIDEADIGLLATNNDVTFTVDAYPTERFQGEIEQIRLNPSTTQNVVTYSVIVGVDNPDLKLKPGMTANLTIIVDSRENVLTVPNTALRYTPPGLDRNTSIRLSSATDSADGDATMPGQAAEASGSGSEAGNRSGRGGGRGFPEGFTPPAGFEGFAGRGARGGGGASGGQAASSLSSTVISPQIGDSVELIPGQMFTGEQIQFQAAPAQPPRPGTVFVMDAIGQPEFRQIMTGITDGTRTEVVSGDLAEGDQVMIGDTSQVSELNNSNTGGTRDMMRIMSGGGGRGGWR